MILRHRSYSSTLFVVFAFLLLAVSAYANSSPLQDDRYIYTSYTLENTIDTRAKRPSYVSHASSDLVCRPFGECEPCPQDELDQPFCLPFGNRRLLHCVLATDADKTTGGSQSGEVPAWEACGKVIKKERQDFWEFVTANLLFLMIALTILWARTSALATEQYRQLAARIGIPGTGWRT